MSLAKSEFSQVTSHSQRRKPPERRKPDELAQVAYLNEHNLHRLLTKLYPGAKFQRGKAVPKSGLRFRPDFRCDTLGLIVEFDGYGHYANGEDAFWDKVKDRKYAELGFRVVSIPYFVQPCTATINSLFGIAFEYELQYGHGFIDPGVVLPSDFCGAGIDKFLADLDRFEYLKKDIIESLRPWVSSLGHIDRVLPRCLQHFLNPG